MFLQGALLFLPLLVSASPSLRKRASGVTTDPSTAYEQTFDYIVVGAGCGGITVAARLAEDSSKTILLVEAGYDERTNPVIYDIYEYGTAFTDTSLTWQWGTDQGKGMMGFVIFPPVEPLGILP